MRDENGKYGKRGVCRIDTGPAVAETHTNPRRRLSCGAVWHAATEASSHKSVQGDALGDLDGRARDGSCHWPPGSATPASKDWGPRCKAGPSTSTRCVNLTCCQDGAYRVRGVPGPQVQRPHENVAQSGRNGNFFA